MLTREHRLIANKRFGFSVNLLRLLWRTVFVGATTLLAILLPFFNDVLGFLGAVGFWPLTVYFPIEMYIRQKKVKKLTSKWVALQTLSFVCFLVSLAAACGSIEGVMESLKSYVPFKTRS